MLSIVQGHPHATGEFGNRYRYHIRRGTATHAPCRQAFCLSSSCECLRAVNMKTVSSRDRIRYAQCVIPFLCHLCRLYNLVGWSTLAGMRRSGSGVGTITDSKRWFTTHDMPRILLYLRGTSAIIHHPNKAHTQGRSHSWTGASKAASKVSCRDCRWECSSTTCCNPR